MKNTFMSFAFAIANRSSVGLMGSGSACDPLVEPARLLRLQLAFALLEKSEIVGGEIHPVGDRRLVDIENDRQFLVGGRPRAALLDEGLRLLEDLDNIAVIGAETLVIGQLQFQHAEIRRLRSVGRGKVRR